MVVGPATPEPAVWAMMALGFDLIRGFPTSEGSAQPSA